MMNTWQCVPVAVGPVFLLIFLSWAQVPARAQRAELFAEQKSLWQVHQNRRIGVLQGAERCVAAAKSAQQFKGCLDKERNIIRNMERQHLNELKNLYKRFGLKLPARNYGQGEGQQMI